MYNPNQDAQPDDWFAQNDPARSQTPPAPTIPITVPPGLNIKPGPTAGQGLPGGTPPAATFGNLADPTAWMGLVGNDANLANWIKSVMPNATPEDIAYWSKSIKAKPGANATEQAGSADYWTKRMLAPAGSGTADGSLIAPFNEPFNAPKPIDLGGPGGLPNTPTFTPPNFEAPTAQSVLSDPGYQFRLGQGEQELQQSAAGKGLLNTGGTLKDVLSYGQNFASNEFQNAWNRNMGTYNAAFQSAAAAFAPQMTGYQTQANLLPGMNQNNYMNAYNKWLQDYNVFRNQQLDTFNKQQQVATS